MSDFDALLKEVMADLEATGDAFINKVEADQLPILKQAVEDSARATLGLVTEPERARVHRETLLMVKSTLEGEAVLSALRAAAQLKSSIQKALSKLVMVGLSVLSL